MLVLSLLLNIALPRPTKAMSQSKNSAARILFIGRPIYLRTATNNKVQVLVRRWSRVQIAPEPPKNVIHRFWV